MTKDKYLWLVNKNNHFDEEMLSQFEYVKTRDSDGKTYIEKQTSIAYVALKEYLLKEYGITLYLTSAGRSLTTQQQVWDWYRADHTEEETQATVALPGTSEHHTGLALDVKPEFAYPALIQKLIDKLPLPERIAYFRQPDKDQKDLMYQALHESLEQFGFILRYTKDKQDITGVKPERWHIRYVGVENAKAINAKGMCLEEYVEDLQAQETQENSATQAAPAEPIKEENITEVVIVDPIVSQVFEGASKAKEEKVQ